MALGGPGNLWPQNWISVVSGTGVLENTGCSGVILYTKQSQNTWFSQRCAAPGHQVEVLCHAASVGTRREGCQQWLVDKDVKMTMTGVTSVVGTAGHRGNMGQACFLWRSGMGMQLVGSGTMLASSTWPWIAEQVGPTQVQELMELGLGQKVSGDESIA